MNTQNHVANGWPLLISYFYQVKLLLAGHDPVTIYEHSGGLLFIFFSLLYYKNTLLFIYIQHLFIVDISKIKEYAKLVEKKMIILDKRLYMLNIVGKKKKRLGKCDISYNNIIPD